MVGSGLTFSEGLQFVKKFVHRATAVLPPSKAFFPLLTVFFWEDKKRIEITSKTSHYIPQFTLVWNLLWHNILGVFKVGEVEAGSIALMAIDVKGVADEAGMPTLL